MHYVIGAVLMIAAEGVALACSCVAPGTPEDSRQLARELVWDAVAIVEVQVLAGYDRASRTGERVRVRRTLFGRASSTFEIERRGPPSSASCDLGLEPGRRRVLVLYPAVRPSKARYRIHGLCSDYLIRTPRHLAVTLREARRRGR